MTIRWPTATSSSRRCPLSPVQPSETAVSDRRSAWAVCALSRERTEDDHDAAPRRAWFAYPRWPAATSCLLLRYPGYLLPTFRLELLEKWLRIVGVDAEQYAPLESPSNAAKTSRYRSRGGRFRTSFRSVGHAASSYRRQTESATSAQSGCRCGRSPCPRLGRSAHHRSRTDIGLTSTTAIRSSRTSQSQAL